ncbi:MAG: hypothetical protein JO333_18965 [Verrucomicrobia bacterium]|nr:hypothetical protein [Verrucomicrobiota bacterium]
MNSAWTWYVPVDSEQKTKSEGGHKAQWNLGSVLTGVNFWTSNRLNIDENRFRQASVPDHFDPMSAVARPAAAAQ